MLRRLALAFAALLAPAALHAQAPKPILETVAGLGDYSMLLEAIETAGLTPTLTGSGPLTLYAPANSAFQRLPADTLKALLGDKARLKRVLAHHLIPGKVTGIDMMNLPIYSKVATANGDSITVYHDKGGIKVDRSMVKVADIAAANGTIHTVHALILVP